MEVYGIGLKGWELAAQAAASKAEVGCNEGRGLSVDGGWLKLCFEPGGLVVD